MISQEEKRDGLGSDFESANRLARYERGGILRLMLETQVEGLVTQGKQNVSTSGGKILDVLCNINTAYNRRFYEF